MSPPGVNDLPDLALVRTFIFSKLQEWTGITVEKPEFEKTYYDPSLLPAAEELMKKSTKQPRKKEEKIAVAEDSTKLTSEVSEDDFCQNCGNEIVDKKENGKVFN